MVKSLLLSRGGRALCLALLVLFGLLTTFRHFEGSLRNVRPPQYPGGLRPHGHGTANNGTFDSPTKSRWCQPDECGVGRWAVRDPPLLTLEDFRAAYANRQDTVWKGCKVAAGPFDPPRTEEEQKLLDETRLMQVSNWDWIPSRGELVPWDAEEFVVRMLRSPGGMLIIGG